MGRKVGSPVKEREINDYFVEAEENIFHALIPPKILWEDGETENRSLTIKLRKRKPEKKVEWTSDTVDNEHMGRRSSKCCCIYEKPRAFGESSTESEEEEEEGCGHTHCVRGHRKGRRQATPGPTPTTPPQPPDPTQPPPGPMQH
ncbi:E3 ubiquitin-protein ligase PPP1R11 isoform X1 [Cavia porcellus]|uniref:E3 ubiquitin-protein ligase PPP1R11 isoform X1 n=1 Tax=Cavia porcellus TaxID=10141 RepID=UPI000351215D|nr:protein phosphatase 1 regulatory subunit 11 isoform X1 [Cavia porcellus]